DRGDPEALGQPGRRAAHAGAGVEHPAGPRDLERLGQPGQAGRAPGAAAGGGDRVVRPELVDDLLGPARDDVELVLQRVGHAATAALISAATAALTSAAARSPRPEARPDRLTPATPGTASSARASVTPAASGSGAVSTASIATGSMRRPGKRCSTRAERSSV